MCALMQIWDSAMSYTTIRRKRITKYLEPLSGDAVNPQQMCIHASHLYLTTYGMQAQAKLPACVHCELLPTLPAGQSLA